MAGRDAVRQRAPVIPLRDDSAGDGQLEGAWSLLPDGEYLAQYRFHETAFTFKTPKVYVHFEIIDPPYIGRRIYRAYRVRRILRRPGKGGGFTVAPRSDLYLQWCRLMNVRERPDRISLRALKGRILRVSTRTVTKDHEQVDTPECLRYSVVDRLLSIEAGGAVAVAVPVPVPAAVPASHGTEAAP